MLLFFRLGLESIWSKIENSKNYLIRNKKEIYSKLTASRTVSTHLI